MLEKAIEIEGLLRIIRDGNPLPETYNLLTAKADSLAKDATALTVEEEDNRKKEEETTAQESEMADFIMASPTPPTTTSHVDFTASAGQPAEQPMIIQNDMAVNQNNTMTDNIEVDLDMAEEDDIILSFDDVPEQMTTTEEPALTDFNFKDADNMLAPAPDPEPDAPEEEIINVADNSENTGKETAAEDKPEPQEPLPAEAVPEKEEPKRQQKLKSAFSLNDRFLYARELFNGNMKIFDSTLEFIEGIEDYSLVEDYFYSELEWDAENSNVASFMEILRPQFRE